jgi:type 1 glutamine amidotransferase
VTTFLLSVLAVSLVLAGILGAQVPPAPGQRAGGPPRQQKPTKKQLLVWCDTTGGGMYHDSVSHAMAVIEKMGRDSGLFDAYLRTDSQLITKQKTAVNADGRDWPVTKTLDYFDGIFFCGLREIPLTDQQFTDLMSFVKDDGKGFVAAHTAITAFVSRPEFAKMLGSAYDNHPWNQVEAKVIVEDPDFPAVKHFPRSFTFRDEMYQVKDFSRENARVLLRLDTTSVDMKNPNIHRTDNDFPQAWAKTYGKGRVFVCAFGHDAATWDKPEIQTMWLEAIKWSLGLTNAEISPRPLSTK